MKLTVKNIVKSSFVILTLSSFGIGCSHAPPKAEAPVETAAATTTEIMSSDNGNALGLETIHFDYDSSLLNAKNKVLLKKDAAVLKSHGSIVIQVEGHTDSRGGIQYNIALGEKRAQSVQHFLQDHGIAKDRISIVSYGKEKPLDTAETEAAYAKNRRANFVIVSK
jgi:peptidoglycan-associated lipoprotein